MSMFSGSTKDPIVSYVNRGCSICKKTGTVFLLEEETGQYCGFREFVKIPLCSNCLEIVGTWGKETRGLRLVDKIRAAAADYKGHKTCPR